MHRAYFLKFSNTWHAQKSFKQKFLTVWFKVLFYLNKVKTLLLKAIFRHTSKTNVIIPIKLFKQTFKFSNAGALCASSGQICCSKKS